MDATPLVGSDAFRDNVTGEMYQPFSPGVPEAVAVDRGAVVSMWTVREWTESERPATSVAWYSTRCCPSVKMNGAAYRVQVPPSTRTEMLATPLVFSVACKDTVTGEIYHPLLPRVPARADVLAGAAVSILMTRWWTASFRPAPFVALKSRLWIPSALTTKGWEKMVQGPPSNRYPMKSGGEVPFTSCKVTVTAETYHPEEPAVPARTACESRAIPLIVPLMTVNECVSSMFPATSIESTWTRFAATPEAASVAERATRIGTTNRVPFKVPENVATVVGAAPSFWKATDLW